MTGDEAAGTNASAGKRLLHWWLWWAKPLSLWMVLLIVALCALRMTPIFLGIHLHRRPALWQMPAISDLHYVDGVLAEPLLQPRSRIDPGLFWGQMTLDDGTLFWFTCLPGTDEPMCAYTAPANRDVNVGKHFRAGYFDVASHRGSNHVLVTLQQIGCQSCLAIMSYEARRAILARYHWTQDLPTFTEWLTIILASIYGPSIVFRLLTGRAIKAETSPKLQP